MRCLLMELSQHIDCAVPRSLLELYEIPWDRKDGRKIIVGTAPAVSAGLQNCLREDFGIQQVAALGIAPEERRISMRYHPYFEELSFTESFTQMKEIFSQYELIISDPILQAAAGSAQFLPLTYAPLSGKQYIDARQSLLGLSGDAWLAAMLETEV